MNTGKIRGLCSPPVPAVAWRICDIETLGEVSPVVGPVLDKGELGDDVPHFLLIVSDASGKHSAHEVASRRLQNRAWPIYKGTRNRNQIAAGDTVWIYLGGHKQFSQSIVARAQVQSMDEQGRRVTMIDDEDALTNPPFKIVRLTDIQMYEPPIAIRPLIGKISFLPDTAKWGASLVGGCRRMPVADARLIERHAHKA